MPFLRGGGRIKAIKAELSAELRKVSIHTFADLHLGDRQCDMGLIKQRIKAVAEDERAYILLNGDIMNNATRTSISDSYAEQLTPMQQIAEVVDLFSPVRDQVLAITSGNHCKRTYKKEGIDLMEIAARELHLHDRFSGDGAVVFLRFGQMGTHSHGRKARYVIYALHGAGGGRKEGAKAIRLADMASIVDADVYIHSHTHLPMIMKQSFMRVDTTNSAIMPVDKLFVNTAATLNYGDYSAEYEYKPSSKANPVIYLDGTRKHMEAVL